jgi:hypothetical protein
MWYFGNCNGPVSTTAGKDMDVISDALTAAAPKISVQFLRRDTGAAAEVANGDQVYITFGLKKSAPL